MTTMAQLPVSPPAIEFRNVSLSFDGERPVLLSVSFAVPAGEMLVITGNSGAGKSVLLRLALGFHRPDEGEVLINGRHIENVDENELLELRSTTLGMVFQEDALFSGLSVYDNAAFRLVEHAWSEADVDRAVREILTFVGLEKDTAKLPEELSIGMRRRLELARALVGWPSIMLFDEPTSGLDPMTSKHVMNLVIRARDVHKISSLYVTKELRQIPYLANHYAALSAAGGVAILEGKALGAGTMRVLMLDRGEVAFLGTSEEFASSALPAVAAMTHPEVGRVITLDELRRTHPPSATRENAPTALG
jgi:phospholipid/cholesterol/gamma-HCH transport system ATP-binding protein